jgi:hypothetical protein
MNLRPVGSTSVVPRTDFLWHPETNTAIEITELGQDHERFLVRASKSFRLIKQDTEAQRELWSRNIGELNQYLADKFNSFQITVDYTDEIVPNATTIPEEAEPLAAEYRELEPRKESLLQEIEKAEKGLNGLDHLTDYFEDKLATNQQELEQVENRLHTVLDRLQLKKQELDEWRKNGVMLAYLFTFSTDPQIADAHQIETTVDNHIDDIVSEARSSVWNKLKRSRFKLEIEELDEPRVFNRVEHTSLLNPVNFERMIDDYPGLEDVLTQLQNTSVRQYQTYALDDIETGAGVVERSKNTPARAIRFLLNDLDTVHMSTGSDFPVDGPMVGTLHGTRQAVGFDPADTDQHGMPHYYILGGTGSGKTYTKRVLIENAASLGHDILSIIPSDGDTQGLGLSFPNPENSKGETKGVAAEQYYPEDNRFPDVPEDVTELFSGVNVVTLSGLEEQRKHGFVIKAFEALDGLDGLVKPLFVFLEEAHNFADHDEVISIIDDIARESRKFDIHLVLVTQFPTDFSHNAAPIRKNLNHVFMKGPFKQYIRRTGRLRESEALDSLSTGKAVFGDWDNDQITVDIRDPLTHTETLSKDQIDSLAERYQKQPPTLPRNAQRERTQPGKARDTEKRDTAAELSDDEQEMVEYVRWYVRENDEAPTHRKCWDPAKAPFGKDKSKRILDQLVDYGNISEMPVKRGGHDTVAYKPE